MQNNLLEYLEQTVLRVPEKTAYSNGKDDLTFGAVYNESREIGTFLAQQGLHREPVVVFMNKHPRTIVAFLGVVYSGNYYVPIDEEMPLFRIEMILQNLNSHAVICDTATRLTMQKINCNCPVYLYDDIVGTSVDNKALLEIRRHQIVTDSVYVVFTSGSTGVPKGVVACHRSVLDYIEVFSEVMALDETAPILAKLGEAKAYFESESCAFPGLEKTYTYTSFNLYTYEDDDKDRVASIVVLDDSIGAAEGIFLNSSLDEVIAKYGDNYEHILNLYKYSSGLMELSFIIEDKVVTSIEYIALSGK